MISKLQWQSWCHQMYCRCRAVPAANWLAKSGRWFGSARGRVWIFQMQQSHTTRNSKLYCSNHEKQKQGVASLNVFKRLCFHYRGAEQNRSASESGTPAQGRCPLPFRRSETPDADRTRKKWHAILAVSIPGSDFQLSDERLPVAKNIIYPLVLQITVTVLFAL